MSHNTLQTKSSRPKTKWPSIMVFLLRTQKLPQLDVSSLCKAAVPLSQCLLWKSLKKKKCCYRPRKWQSFNSKWRNKMSNTIVKVVGVHRVSFVLFCSVSSSCLQPFLRAQKQSLCQKSKVAETLENPWPWLAVSKYACNPRWQTDGVTSSRPVGVHFKCRLSLCSSSDSIALWIHSQSAQTCKSLAE